MNGIRIVTAITTIFLVLQNSNADVTDAVYQKCLDAKQSAEDDVKIANQDGQECIKEKSKCNDELTQSKKDLDACNKDKGDCDKDKKKCEGDKTTLQKSLDDCNNDKKAAAAANDKLTKEKEDLTKEKQQLEDKVKDLEKNKDDLTKENQEADDKIKELQKLLKIDPDAKPIIDKVPCVDKLGAAKCSRDVQARRSQCRDDFVFGRFQCCKSCVTKLGGDPTKQDDPVLQFISTPKVCQDATASDGTSYTTWCEETAANKPKSAPLNCNTPAVISKCTQTCGYCKK